MRRNWIDSPALPEKRRWYDLCKIDLGDKEISGWWTGTQWEGLQYNGEPVKRWIYFEMPHD